MTKKELKKELEELLPQVESLFRAFIDDKDNEKLHIEFTVKKDQGYLVGHIALTDIDALCKLSIIKKYYIYPESEDLDNKLIIEIKWFDWADALTYTSEYFADVSNKAAFEKAKTLIDSASTLAKKSYDLIRK